MLDLTKVSCERLKNAFTALKDDSSDESKEQTGKSHKRETILKSIPIIDDIESDEEIEEDD